MHCANAPLALEEAGIFLLVLSSVTDDEAAAVTERLRIPTIGIGAGPHCDGQVQVFHDLLGLGPPFAGDAARAYADGAAKLDEAVARFAADVRARTFA